MMVMMRGFVTTPTGCRVFNDRFQINGFEGCLLRLRVDSRYVEVFFSYTDIDKEIAALQAVKAEIDASRT